MSQLTLSRELALRIGLAARALPDTQPKHLVQVLTDLFGLPLTEGKLATLTLQQFRRALLPRAYPSEVVQQALSLLLQNAGERAKADDRVRMQSYRAGDMPHSIRIAVASDDGVHIDGQFSACPQFYIFQVSADERRLIAIRSATTQKPMKSEQKQHYRAEIIQDCQVFYSQSIGGPAAVQVIKQGVHPVKLNGTPRIADIIDQLQHVLQTSPPPWLAKSMGMAKHPSQPSLQEDKL